MVCNTNFIGILKSENAYAIIAVDVKVELIHEVSKTKTPRVAALGVFLSITVDQTEDSCRYFVPSIHLQI